MNTTNRSLEKWDNPLAVQSNALIHARYEMTMLQKKLLLMLISKIRREDDDFKVYKIRVKDFKGTAGLSSTQIYSKLKKATEGLLGIVFKIKKETGELQISILSSAEYFKGRGLMELCFDPKLKPYLLQLQKQFTQIPIKQVMTLRSVYAIRIYEMLQQFKTNGFFITKVDDLKYKLGLENKYKSYNLFKKNVILQAQNELMATDMAFTFEEIKESRRIDRIKFKLIPFQERELTASQSQLQTKLIEDLKVSLLQAKKIVLKLPASEIHKTIFDVKAAQRDGNIKTNIAAYAISVFNHKYGIWQ